MIKTDTIEKQERDEPSDTLEDNFTDLVKCDQVLNRVNTYLSHAPLNIGKDDYCYVKIVSNHLEIGRARIILEE